MALLKVVFMAVEPGYGASTLIHAPAVIAGGLSMDISMSAYLVSPVLLGLIAGIWWRPRYGMTVLKTWTWIISAFIAIVWAVDAATFPFWDVKLDFTPLFYFFSSPKAAVASVPWWASALGVVLIALLTFGIYKFMSLSFRILRGFVKPATVRARILATAGMLVIAGLMIIPIRGGIGVSTMNPGRAYFGTDLKLNQAAVNPGFSLLYSLAHIEKLDKEFRFYDDAEARKIVASFTTPCDTAAAPVVRLREGVTRPDIYIVVMESFSAHLLPSLGGEAVAVNVDSIARSGVLFTNFYAESFRTDRGLVSILSGYRAMPTISVMHYTGKFRNMPSLGRELAKAGYNTTYYSGGDLNFTNKQAYLLATGYKNLVQDRDFPVGKRLSKWGVHDGEVFKRVMSDRRRGPEPQFTVIQTASSHEPFEVPYHKFDVKQPNAFAYADSCIGAFVRHLAGRPEWNNTVVVLVPDHWGAWPKVTEPNERHHIPLVLTGGALAGTPARINTLGSQSAIAPTLLALLGLDNSMFPQAVNMLDGCDRGHFAWITEPEWFGLLTDSGDEAVVDIHTGTLRAAAGDSIRATEGAKAMIQTVYSDISKR